MIIFCWLFGHDWHWESNPVYVCRTCVRCDRADFRFKGGGEKGKG